MRIAFVSDSVYPYHKGGKEKRLYELSKRLSQMGHDVHIYTMHWWKTPDKTSVEHGVTLHAICKYHPLYKGDRRSASQAIFFGVACLKLIRVKFDVIDVDHMPYFPIFSAWIVCKLRRRKLNGTWHEALKRSDWVDYMGRIGNIMMLVERLCVHLPHQITVSSAHTMDLIKTELGRTRGLRLVPPGIDSNSIDEAEPININFDVLFVGRLVKDKNAALLVRAIDVLVKQHPNVECIIIGTGLEEKNLLRLIDRHNLKSNVHLIGNLPRSRDIYAYMKAAKVLVLPSKREGFGMVVLEALACGTPVVTIDSPANAAKQLITDGVSGSVVSPTPAALAAAIAEWIEKTPERQTIIEQTTDYDWQNLADKQAEVYAA